MINITNENDIENDNEFDYMFLTSVLNLFMTTSTFMVLVIILLIDQYNRRKK